MYVFFLRFFDYTGAHILLSNGGGGYNYGGGYGGGYDNNCYASTVTKTEEKTVTYTEVRARVLFFYFIFSTFLTRQRR